jgi:FAD/FMN-containing dehydrogenase
LLDCRKLDRFVNFDAETGVLRCEAGVTLEQILEFAVPRGWFLPVTPGTKFVTIGGAIANDVHGKNHHRGGTFGCHVRCFELLRSDGTRRQCSMSDNVDYFRATIGGMGLTGLITWAEVQLKEISSAAIEQEVIRFGNLDEFFELASESDEKFEYTVAWIDCLAKGSDLGRGFFTRGNHAADASRGALKRPSHRIPFPVDPPFAFVNKLTLKLFNAAYYRKQLAKRVRNLTHYDPFFYPLDTIRNWNRIYGSAGLFQYQCVVPPDAAPDAIAEILRRIAKAGTGSFLAVLKMFGKVSSPGLLSFPRPGATLALDFPNRGDQTLELLDQLDDVTRSAGGAVNPSKDARMAAADFRRSFEKCEDYLAFVDPNFSSGFWRRVMSADT